MLITPDGVHFRTAQGSAARQSVRLRCISRPDGQILRVESANPSISGKVAEVSRKGGDVTYELTVDLAGDVKAGELHEELTLVTNDSDPRKERTMVPVEASVVAAVTNP
jgi:hypothetical protein